MGPGIGIASPDNDRLSWPDTLRSHKEIPGPGPLDLLLGLHPNPQAYCHRLMRRYGDVVRCRLWKDVFVINHPDLARQLLSEVHRKVDKQHFINERMKRVFGNGAARFACR